MEDEVMDKIQEMDEPGNEQAKEPMPEPSSAETAELRLLRGGNETGDAFTISRRAVVGRFDAAVGPVDIDLGPLPEGSYISRKHAEIYCEDSKWFIKDLGSSNGTFVLPDGADFQKVTEATELRDGQQIALGNARFTFHIGASEKPEEAAAAKEAISEEEASSGLG